MPRKSHSIARQVRLVLVPPFADSDSIEDYQNGYDAGFNACREIVRILNPNAIDSGFLVYQVQLPNGQWADVGQTDYLHRREVAPKEARVLRAGQEIAA